MIVASAPRRRKRFGVRVQQQARSQFTFSATLPANDDWELVEKKKSMWRQKNRATGVAARLCEQPCSLTASSYSLPLSGVSWRSITTEKKGLVRYIIFVIGQLIFRRYHLQGLHAAI